MMLKFIAKEIRFLKKNGDAPDLRPPDVYYSDLLTQPSKEFKIFSRRIADTCASLQTFTTVAIQIDPAASEETIDKANEIFHACFHSVLDDDKGIWECLDPFTAIFVFWNYKTADQGKKLLGLLNDKISQALNAELIMGAIAFPFHNFPVEEMAGCALKALDHAAFFGPGHTVEFDGLSLNISGDRLFQLNNIDAAITEYEKGLSIAPVDINLLNSLGVAFGVDACLDKAMEFFEKARNINPEEVMVIHNIGLIHRINERNDSALAYLRKAHAINPDVFEIELLLGHLLFKENEFDLAMPHLDAAIRLKPESGTAFRIKGQLFLAREDYAGAAAQFNQAVKLNPNDPKALSGYARAMALQKKNLSIALSFAQKSLDLDPENKQYKQNLEKIQNIQDRIKETNQDLSIKSA
ncbi:tetratricopeptide repeat protein [Desulfobacter latus]|uniref:Tetratricopeptide repeat protein n=1 Tax=Desulfobacter latus TaxID=2292 RepID=A0A850SV74_9BACT|nr:tetratricopeptide repeat protein [Desulfobacter latus]NWH03950.1 tetratricopeptide repeat protein [Desulfobacter latus]